MYARAILNIVLPCRFNEAIGGLTAHRSCYDFTMFVDVAKCGASDEFLIEVGVEFLGVSTCVCSKCIQCKNYIPRTNRLQTIQPGVPSGNVNEEESIAEAAERHTITEDDVQVNFVRVFLAFLYGFTSGRHGD